MNRGRVDRSPDSERVYVSLIFNLKEDEVNQDV